MYTALEDNGKLICVKVLNGQRGPIKAQNAITSLQKSSFDVSHDT